MEDFEERLPWPISQKPVYDIKCASHRSTGPTYKFILRIF
jgi:hypothetical protein